MLRSNLCVLNNTSPELMQQMGESKYEPGGYFIIDGAEKVIVSQERRCENKLFFEIPTQLNFKDKQTHAVEIKSASMDEFAPARSVRVQMEKEGTITVRLGQNNPFIMPNEGRDVPLFVFFRMLGVISDKEIIEFICHDLNDSLSQKMMNLLRPSASDPFILQEEIYDQVVIRKLKHGQGYMWSQMCFDMRKAALRVLRHSRVCKKFRNKKKQQRKCQKHSPCAVMQSQGGSEMRI